MLSEGTTVTAMASMLASVGATPWDIATIFKTLKKVGALKARTPVLM